MRALILAAGYATRMHPLTLERPKPLLPVGGRPIIDRLLENVCRVEEIGCVAVVTNRKFLALFEEWWSGRSFDVPVEILDDGTTSNETRLGALGDLRLALERLGPGGDCLVVAGDNVFPFELRDLVRFFHERGTDVATCYRQVDPVRLRRTGVAVLGDEGRILELQEKPERPRSEWAVPPVYVYTERTLAELPAYLEEGNPPDAPGHFLAWISSRRPVFALRTEAGPHDIGTLESYREADRLFS